VAMAVTWWMPWIGWRWLISCSPRVRRTKPTGEAHGACAPFARY